MNLKLIVTNTFKVVTTAGSTTRSNLHLPQLLSGQPKRELVATPLVLEPIDAPQGLRHRHVEDQVGKREECDGYPAMAALEARGLSLGQEDKAQEDEE